MRCNVGRRGDLGCGFVHIYNVRGVEWKIRVVSSIVIL